MNTENVIDGLAVHNKNCIGCKRMNRAIIITITLEDPTNSERQVFHDYALTEAQADWLLKQLQQRIIENNQ